MASERSAPARPTRAPDPLAIPAAVRRLLDALAAAGFPAWLVGGCVRDLVRGAPVADFDVATAAPPERVLALFPRAIPIAPRHGTLMVPTGAGPVDVTTYRAGPRIEDDLAHRDLTVNAMAYDPRAGRLLDPFGGRADLAAGRLRAVGGADARFAEDPLRALRVARLAAQLGFRVDPALETAMRRAAPALAGVARERIRQELEALFRAPQAQRGLELLRGAGIEAALAPGTRADAPAVVGRLGPDLALRLAAWLRGTPAEAILLRLRFPSATAARVARLLRVHPLEEGVEPERGAEVRRLIRRAGEENLAALFALRAAELAAGGAPAAARARLEALAGAVERVRAQGALALRRQDLALDGGDVMAILGCGPGRRVGEALQHLTECVIEDPACNSREALRERLLRWSAGHAAR